MTTLIGTTNVSARPFGLLAAYDDLRIRFIRWRLYRQTLSELQTLSERELDDLGLTRGTIREVAQDAADSFDV